MLSRFTTLLHVITALLALTLSFWIVVRTLVHLDEIHPTTHAGWNNEQFSVAFVLMVAAVMVLLTARRIDQSNASRIHAILAAFGVYLVAFAAFGRYFWASAAGLSTLSGIDAFVCAYSMRLNATARAVACLAALVLTLIIAAFALTSFLWVGQ